MAPHLTLAALAALTATTAQMAPALAGTRCTFTFECYMTEACTSTDWTLWVDPGAGRLSSAAEDWTLLHASEDGSQMLASGTGSLALLSIGKEVSLFTTHIAGDTAYDPITVTFFGECVTE
ncbi:MAG: hypothetical protein CSA74_08195 [Rhodobacterales bacterium]|nr:MAG: hypothetical protein CSA74_08195 [Rhodobacterales bacterium]